MPSSSSAGKLAVCFVFSIRSCSAETTAVQGLVVMYAISQLVFGIGIGGEYPQTSTRATEESGEDKVRGQRHRGRKVMLAYTMQGWGQFVNLAVLILLLLIFNRCACP